MNLDSKKTASMTSQKDGVSSINNKKGLSSINFEYDDKWTEQITSYDQMNKKTTQQQIDSLRLFGARQSTGEQSNKQDCQSLSVHDDRSSDSDNEESQEIVEYKNCEANQNMRNEEDFQQQNLQGNQTKIEKPFFLRLHPVQMDQDKSSKIQKGSSGQNTNKKVNQKLSTQQQEQQNDDNMFTSLNLTDSVPSRAGNLRSIQIANQIFQKNLPISNFGSNQQNMKISGKQNRKIRTTQNKLQLGQKYENFIKEVFTTIGISVQKSKQLKFNQYIQSAYAKFDEMNMSGRWQKIKNDFQAQLITSVIGLATKGILKNKDAIIAVQKKVAFNAPSPDEIKKKRQNFKEYFDILTKGALIKYKKDGKIFDVAMNFSSNLQYFSYQIKEKEARLKKMSELVGIKVDHTCTNILKYFNKEKANGNINYNNYGIITLKFKKQTLDFAADRSSRFEEALYKMNAIAKWSEYQKIK